MNYKKLKKLYESNWLKSVRRKWKLKAPYKRNRQRSQEQPPQRSSRKPGI